MAGRYNTVLMAIAFSFAIGVAQQAEKKVVPFNASAYPPDKFSVTSKDYCLNEITIQVVQVKGRGSSQEPRACRAWFKVKKGDQLLNQVYFDDIDAVGFSFGVFVPRNQPLPDRFIAVKEGDYDGRLLIVSETGVLANLPGGFYFLTDDKRFLVGEQVRDDSPLIVVDTTANKVIIDGRKSKTIPEVKDWYRDNLGYFFTGADQSGQAGRAHKGQVYRLDLEHLTMVRVPITIKQLAAAHKVVYDFDPRKMRDCTSLPQ
jgi:hypothetical protein